MSRFLQLGFVCLLSLSLVEFGAGNRKQVEVNFARYEAFIGPHFAETAQAYHQRMTWFDEATRGMLIHLGLYSHLEGSWKGREIAGNNAEWIWDRLHREPQLEVSNQEYMDLVKDWRPTQFDAKKIVALAGELGMNYVTITAKHHEGFCLWPSEYTEFDIDSTPMKGRDLLRELADACREAGLRFGVYYSILDWHYTLNEAREAGKDWERMTPSHGRSPMNAVAYTNYVKNQMREIITGYDIDFVRFDGDWLESYLTPERSYDLYEFLRELKPSLLINERCFSRDFADAPKKDFGTVPNLNPTEEFIASQQNPETRSYYEFMLSTQVSWGYDGRRAHAANSQYTTPQRMLECYALLRQVEGNFLLNFGPRKDGSFDPMAVKFAQEFAHAAKQLKEVGYGRKQVRAVSKSLDSELREAKNPAHFRHANPEAFQRLEAAKSHQRQISQWERWQKQKKKLNQAELEAARKELERLANDSQGNQDPKEIINQIVNYQERVKRLLN